MILPAVALALPLLSAVPEDFGARRLRQAEICQAAQDAEDLVEELATSRREPQWRLADAARDACRAAGEPFLSARIVPIAESEGEQEGLLWAILVSPPEGGAALVPWCFHLHRNAEGWSADVPSLAAPAMRPPDKGAKITRRSGIALDRLPVFLLAVFREETQRFQDAEKEGDAALCAAILEETMTGFSIAQFPDVLGLLREGPRSLELVRPLGKRPEGDPATWKFELVVRGQREEVPFDVGTEGGGWVILPTRTAPEAKTMSAIRTLATAIEAYAVDHDASPDAPDLETLRTLLEPVYVSSMPAADARGNALEFRRLSGDSSYRIRSAGSDGRFQPDGSWTPGPITREEDDLVYEDGEFVTYLGEPNR